MKKILKLSHHQHTGRYKSHEHTSYFPLLIILVLTSIILIKGTFTVQAQSLPPTPGPEPSSVSLTGAVPEPPPEDPARITSPNDQDRFSQSPITIEGTCPPNTLVEVLKSNIFAGSALCSDEGTFEVVVDLLIGENELVLRVYNSLNQPGPNSDPVTVYYDALPPQSSPLDQLDFNDAQLIINTDAIYRGRFPNEDFVMPVEVIGGTPPYAVEINWGDSNSTVIPRDNNLPFNATHVYTRPGTFKITLQATDAQQRVAFLTVVAIINGQPQEIAATTDDSGTGSGLNAVLNQLYVMWPITAASLAMVLSFWLGEQREKHILLKNGVVIN